jgi:sialate O-acetylesterase
MAIVSRDSRKTAYLAGFLCCMFLASRGMADVRLPHVFSYHMVLQREAQLPIWGWAAPGEEVTVRIGANEAKARADATGKWMVKLPPMQAGGPHEMTVSGKNTIHIADVLVGEVWVASGQSNMALSVNASADGAKEAAAADWPSIRLFHVPQKPAGMPAQDVAATWQVCSPATAAGFSAVAYFFGREIHNELKVPVGLINTSWSGTRIEPWTPPEGFADVEKLRDIAAHIQEVNAQYRKSLGESLDRLESWLKLTRQALAENGPLPAEPEFPPHPLNSHGQPTGLYNGMVHPLVPFAIRGAIWYQGEANVGEGMLYHEKMKALIGGWRRVWNQGDFPFYYVQLAPYTYGGKPATALPEIWEAQVATLSVPNTGMAVTVDIGNPKDIHPRNKQEVGRRLALWALAKTYGREGTVYSGPLYKAMEHDVNAIRVKFDHVGSGLVSRDGKPLTCFEIAGEDKKFVAADAQIDGDSVLVSSKDVPNPVAVRFAWRHDAEPNLMNKEGLPASPFRTDRW